MVLRGVTEMKRLLTITAAEGALFTANPTIASSCLTEPIHKNGETH